MNIVFVCHGNATSQSTYHVLSIAEKLALAGHACIVCIPSHKFGDIARIRPSAVPVLDFAQVASGGLPFPDGQGPTLMHCWTPREMVRKFAVTVLQRYRCPYFVHLEDNEHEVLARELDGITYEALAGLPDGEQELHIRNPELRIHPAHHWEFLKAAAGCTVLIERLKEHVPPGVPTQLFWPGFDDCFTIEPQQSRAQLREQHRIPADRFVVLYTGAFHAINRGETRRMVTALKILANRGMPLTFIKTGHNEFPELLQKGIDDGWIRELGFLHRNRLHELYLLADVLIQPGRSDPFNDYRFPSKLPEALAMKVPVILPRCNLGLELEDGVEALVTEDDSMQCLIDRIVYLYENPEAKLRIGEAGWRFCQQHLRWEKAAREIEAFYASCLAVQRQESSAILAGSSPQATESSAPSPALAAEPGPRSLRGPVTAEDLRQLRLEERDLEDPGPGVSGAPPGSVPGARRLTKDQRRVRKYKRLYVAELVIIVALLITLYVHG